MAVMYRVLRPSPDGGVASVELWLNDVRGEFGGQEGSGEGRMTQRD